MREVPPPPSNLPPPRLPSGSKPPRLPATGDMISVEARCPQCAYEWSYMLHRGSDGYFEWPDCPDCGTRMIPMPGKPLY